MTTTPIAIVGMSCLFPRAPGLKGYWRVLRAGLDCIADVPDSHWPAEAYFDADPKSPDRTYCRRGGFLDAVSFDPTEFQMPPNALEATDTSQILGLVVAKAALDDAGYGEGRTFERERTSVILGVTGCLELVIPLGARLGHPIWREALHASGVSPEVAEDVVRRISGAYVPWQENSFPGLLGNVVAGRIANRLDLRGTNCVVDAACASSHSAAHLATLELAAGRADMVVTGGVDTFNDIFMYMCFSKTPALSPSGEIRPFSAEADGTLLGEGIGMAVLKRLADAERDGDRIYAVIRGVGTSSDGEGQAIYAPVTDGQRRCLDNAYRTAAVDPSTIGLVEAHGTGTKVGDVVEFEALRAVFGPTRDGRGWCALGSVKSQIGHTKAAAGSAGLLKGALALYHKVLPPTLKAPEANPRLDIASSPFYLSGEARPWLSEAGHPRRAALSAFGFGGSNYHIILEEHNARRVAPAWDGSVEIVALSAADRPALLAALEAVRNAPEGLAEAAWRSRQTFSAQDACRLVVVLEGDAEPTLARAADALQRPVPGVWFGEGEAAGKVAFMFPGQGSQYVAMGRELACVFPEVLDALEASGMGSTIFPAPPLIDAHAATLTQTENAQPALGAVSTGLLEVLRRFGLAPDFACGHSYGELVALHAAGRMDRETLYRASRERGLAMSRLGGDLGTMIAVTAPLQEVERLLADRGLDVTLANRNAPTQAILSGSREAIDRAAEACREAGLKVQALQVSAAFHSPLVAEARGPFRAALQDVAFPAGRFPVYANRTAQPYPDDAAASRELLADQLVHAVDFVGQIENLYAAGARVFVEVGPRATLSGLVRAILGSRAHLACAVDASAGRASGLADLARVLAQCATAGVTVDLRAWETAPPPQRKKKMEVKLVGANYRSPRTSAPPLPAPVNNGGGAHPVEAAKATAPPPTSAPPAPIPAPIPAAAPVAIPAPVAAPPRGLLEEAFRSVQGSLTALQGLQETTASVHQRFLEGQEAAQRTFQQMLEGQQRLVERMLSGGAAAPAPTWSPALPPAPAPVAPPAPAPSPVVVAAAPPPPAPVVVPPPPPVPAPVAVAAPAPTGQLESVLLALVADKTGYPVEMLHLDMDLESDLGIDSIKRVEILAGMEERAPQARRIETDRMGSLRTLRQVVEVIGGGSPAPAAAPPPAPPSNGHATHAVAENALLEVIAEKTGYPREMLGLEMDLESDLGIDSIKRVEILAAMEDRLPQAVRVETDRMGSLRTLRQVLEAMVPASPRASVAVVEAPPPASAPIVAPPAEAAPAPLQRQVLIAVEAPAVSAGSLHIAADHEIRVTDDGGDLSTALVAALRVRGHEARLVGLAQAAAAAERPCGGLVIVAPARAPVDAVSPASEQMLKFAFRAVAALAPELRAAAAAGGALLATVSRMDGAFGLRAGGFDPVLGGLSGLPRTAAHEWSDVRCRALDVAATWTDALVAASAIASELDVAAPLEAGLAPVGRTVLATEARATSPGAPPVSPGDVVVITGGARGVTAETALAMAGEWRPTVVLLGRSPEPVTEPPWLDGLFSEADLKRAILQHHFNGHGRPAPAELERAYREYAANREVSATLRRLHETGARAVYRSVDVRDGEAVHAVLSELRRTLGPIRGLVHAAGVLADRRIEDKTPEQFAAVLDTKLTGLRHLLAACAEDDLRFLALFSSVTARYGRPGQVDYCMANEAFNKVAQQESRRRPGCKVVSMNWGPWDGGMVTDGLRKEFARLGVGLIPLQAGAQALVRELCHPDREVEILVGDGFPQGSAPVEAAAVAFELPVSLPRDPFLDSHRLAGRAVVPVAMLVEWMGHAALHATPGMRFVGIDDLAILKGVTLDDAAELRLRFLATAPREGDDGMLEIEMEARSEAGLHARGRVRLAAELPAAPTLPPPAASRDERPYVGDPYARLFHGPQFHAIRAIQGVSEDSLVADLKGAPRPAEWIADPPRSEWLGDPLVLDGGLQMGLLWCFERMGAPSLPTRGARYRQYVARFPREGARAWLQVRSHGSRSFVADLTFVDAQGRVLARCESFEWAADASLERAFMQVASTGG